MSTLRPRIANHDQHERQILDIIEDLRPVTQRSLSSDLGIALGLTNLLIRRLVTKGWIRARRVSPQGLRYVLTPAGVAARARLTHQYFIQSLDFYRESRARVRDRLALLSGHVGQHAGTDRPRIVFYGVGPDAEVAYVCLQETPLDLVGVVTSDACGERFFHFDVVSPSKLEGRTLAGEPFGWLIIMPLQSETAVREQLSERGVPSEAVFWL